MSTSLPDFQLVPTIFTSDLRDFAVGERRCLFHDELQVAETEPCFLKIAGRCFGKDPHLLRTYSQSGCFFECMLQFAYLRCNCLPWNFPPYDRAAGNNLTTHLCDMQGHNCFNRNFYSQSTVPSKDALCPFCSSHPDCEVNKYEVYQTKIRIDDPEEVCGESWLIYVG